MWEVVYSISVFFRMTQFLKQFHSCFHYDRNTGSEQKDVKAVATTRRGPQPPKLQPYSTVLRGLTGLFLPVHCYAEVFRRTASCHVANEWASVPNFFCSHGEKAEGLVYGCTVLPISIWFQCSRGVVGECAWVWIRNSSGPLKFSATQGGLSCKSEIRRGERRCTVEQLD